jgi:hypothetical protein
VWPATLVRMQTNCSYCLHKHTKKPAKAGFFVAAFGYPA